MLHKPHGAFRKYCINLSNNSARIICVVEHEYTFVNRNKTYSLGIRQSFFSPNIHFRKLQSFSNISSEGLVFRTDEKIPCCLSQTLQVIRDVALDSRNIDVFVIVPRMNVVGWQRWSRAMAHFFFFFGSLSWLAIWNWKGRERVGF